MTRLAAIVLVLASAMTAFAGEVVEKTSGFFPFPPAQAVKMPLCFGANGSMFSARRQAQGICVVWSLPPAASGTIILCSVTGRLAGSYAIDSRRDGFMVLPRTRQLRGIYILSFVSPVMGKQTTTLFMK